jgi:hypothetical protein
MACCAVPLKIFFTGTVNGIRSRGGRNHYAYEQVSYQCGGQ